MPSIGSYRRIKNTRLPDGSGFDKLVMRRNGMRADSNNLPGKQNDFGDKQVGTLPKARTASATRALNTQTNNPRQGQEYTTSVDLLGRKIHTYKYGKNTTRVVVPKSKSKKSSGGGFVYY